MDGGVELLRQVDDLIDDRVRIVSGELRAAPAAAAQFAVVGFVRGQEDAFVFGVAGLSAALLAAGFFGRGGFDVGAVGGGRTVGIVGVLAELGFEFRDAGGEADDLKGQDFECAGVALHRRGQSVEDFRG